MESNSTAGIPWIILKMVPLKRASKILYLTWFSLDFVFPILWPIALIHINFSGPSAGGLLYDAFGFRNTTLVFQIWGVVMLFIDFVRIHRYEYLYKKPQGGISNERFCFYIHRMKKSNLTLRKINPDSSGLYEQLWIAKKSQN